MSEKKYALSIRNPISYYVASGIKWVENRSWKTEYRGKLYIHSGGSFKCDTLILNLHFPTVLEKLNKFSFKKFDSLTKKGLEIDEALEKLDDSDYSKDVKHFFDGFEKIDRFCDSFYHCKDYISLYNDEANDKKIDSLIKKYGYSCQCGAIIGTVNLVDIVQGSKSAWAQEDCYHWIFENAKLLKNPIKCKGQLRLFDVSDVV